MPPHLRRFTLTDAVVLIAATALAMAWVRQVVVHFSTDPYTEGMTEVHGVSVPRLWEGWSAGVVVHYAPHLMLSFGPAFAGTWTLAALILRLRRPRPARRRLWRQPGAVALLAAALCLVGSVVAEAVNSIPYILKGMWSAFDSVLACLDEATEPAAFAVVACWTTLALGRRLRAEPSWIDRFGRLLGAFWIALAIDNRWIPIQESIWPSYLIYYIHVP